MRKFPFRDTTDLLALHRKPSRVYQRDIPQFIPPTAPGLRLNYVQLVMIGSGYQQFLPANLNRRYLQIQLWEFIGEFVGLLFEYGPSQKIALPTTPGYIDLINKAININSLSPVKFEPAPTEPVTIILKGTPGELVRGMITEGI